MTPHWETARIAWNKDCASEGKFDDVIAWHWHNGVVINSPDLFALVEPQGSDAWFVTSLAATSGSGWLWRLMEFCGYRPFIRWRRNGEKRLREYRWEQLMRRS